MNNVIDYKLALDQAAGNQELAKELFEMLLDELPVLKQKLNIAIKENDLQSCWDHTHKIYGSTAYCGVPALRTSAQIMESAVKAEDIDKIKANFTLLAIEIDKVLEQGPNALSSDWAG